MAVAKEIRNKIRSIKNTQKITSAMEMIAASKMRKAQQRKRSAEPYAQEMFKVIGHLARSHSEYHHPYLMSREVKREGFIIISTDRGLCGGFNANLFRMLLPHFKALTTASIEIDLCLVGKKAEQFFKRFGGKVLGSAAHIGDAPSVSKLIGIVQVMLQAYDEKKIDKLSVVYNQFINTMSQKPVIKQLLPLPPGEEVKSSHHWDYIYEPDAKEILDALLARYIESQVYQAVLDNNASEQAARRMAMKSATDNAGELINQFQLVYNKARQAAITQEIAEIVGGAAAV